MADKSTLMLATELLDQAIHTLADRTKDYDAEARGGERSIPKVVAAFNVITGHKLTNEQGWLFMVLLKAVRSQQGAFKPDSYVDGSAYFSLMGEEASEERVPKSEN